MLPKSVIIGPFTLHLYGLIIAISIYLGWLLAKKRAHFYKIPQKLLEDPILILPLFLSIAAARLYHVLDLWDFYKLNPGQIYKISNGGLGIWGGIGGLLVGLWLVAKIRRVNILPLLDLASPSLLLGQAVGRIGNYINQEGFGPPTNLPWGVYISPENRPMLYPNSTHFHPTFFYEAIINAIFLIVILKLSKRAKRPGQVFALYLIFYSTGRFIVEFLRIDTATISTIKVAQVLCILAFAIGVFLLSKFKSFSL